MNDAENWIKMLQLVPHPEGGFYREVYRSAKDIPVEFLRSDSNNIRSLFTSIYFLLYGEQFSAFHKIKSDEIWNFYAGCAIILHIIQDNGSYKKVKLDNIGSDNSQPQFLVPADNWFAAELNEKNSFALAGCTVSPGFDFDDFELGEKDLLLSYYPEHKNLIEKFTIK